MSDLIVSNEWEDYELVDSGDGQKLEKWGGYVMIRPEPRAIWTRQKPDEWKLAEAVYEEEGWKIKSPPPEPWTIGFDLGTGDKCRFSLRTTDFRHTGVFPEQAANWRWIKEKIKSSKNQRLKILNLFAYTGGATMAACSADAQVTHVDASRPALMWASENYKLSKLATDRVRWIQDDALKFVQREQRRGVVYDGIIMDPPRFGRGANGEVWKLEDNLPKLVHECKKVLSEEAVFFLINAYTADLSHLAVRHVLEDALKNRVYKGRIDSGELGISDKSSGRVLPAGIYTRWDTTS